MKIFQPFFVLWTLCGALWGCFLPFAVAISLTESGNVVAVVARIYAVLVGLTAALSVPAMFAHPPKDLVGFIVFPLIDCMIFGMAAYGIGWDRRWHGDWSFQKWYLWGKRLLLTGFIGIVGVLLVAVFVISAKPHKPNPYSPGYNNSDSPPRQEY